MTLLTPTIVVAERGQLWLAAMRTCLRRSGALRTEPRWVHVSAGPEVADALGGNPAAWVLLEVTPQGIAELVLQIEQWREAFPECCIVAAYDRQDREMTGREVVAALQEAGAAHVVRSPRKISDVLALLERHATAAAARMNGEHDDGFAWNPNLSPAWQLPTVRLPASWSLKPNEFA